MTPHLRLALILVVVPVLVVIGLPWALRGLPVAASETYPWSLVPRTFGENGYYRGSNVGEWTSIAPRFAGDVAVCNTCHQGQFSSWSGGAHKVISCQTCHGTRANHVLGKPDPRPASPELAPLVAMPPIELCSTCHDARVVGRPVGFPQVNPETHAGKTACTLCHSPHNPQPGGRR
ncbi:MAG: hypothetical protein HY687_04325 [Chloroflexi bacterium]|nr:hypothetical protein [Chloroflexota bacterium]